MDINIGDLVVYSREGKKRIMPYRPSWMHEPMVVEDISSDGCTVTVVSYNDPNKRTEELKQYLVPV